MRLSPFVRNVALTSGASLVGALANVLVVRILLDGLGEAGFGAYSVANRVFATAAPVLTVTMGIALPRYIAQSRSTAQMRSYLRWGTLLAVAPSLAAWAIVAAVGEGLAGPVFGGSGYARLLSATFFLAAGFAVFTVLNSFYFGTGRFARANLWQVALGGAGAIAAAVLAARAHSVVLVMVLMGAMYFLAGGPLTLHLLRGGRAAHDRAPALELVRYGGPRVLGGLAMAGLLNTGPFLAPHMDSLRAAGYLLIGQTVLRLAELGTGAFSLVALPSTGRLLGQGQAAYVKERMGDLLGFVVHVGLYATLHLLVWTEDILRLWLGPQHPSRLVPLMRLFVLGLAPYLAYVMLRGVIDALEVRPVNTINVAVSLGVTLAVSIPAGSAAGVVGLAAGTLAGLLTLGATTWGYAWRYQRAGAHSLQLFPVLALNVACVAISLGAMLVARSSGWNPAPVMVGAELLAAGVYLFGLRALGTSWLRELAVRVRMEPARG